MKTRTKVSVLAFCAALGLGATAWAGGFTTNTGINNTLTGGTVTPYPFAGGVQYPSTIPLTGKEGASFDTQLPNGQNPQTEGITVQQLGQYAANYVASGAAQLLVAGDATQNTYPFGTAGISATTAVKYQNSDWFAWSGTSTAMTVSKDTTAGDLPTGFATAYKMAETASQTGLVPVCMGQEVLASTTAGVAGSTLEFSFYATAGATFAADTNGQITAYIIYGKDSGGDNGSVNMAYGLNAGGGGSSGWSGQTNAVAQALTVSTTPTRYVVYGTVPAAATEVGVAVCFTPTATAGATNYVAFAGLQLAVDNAASYLTGTGSAVGTGAPVQPFNSIGLQASQAQQNYFVYSVAEPATAAQVAVGYAASTTTCWVQFQWPAAMRAAPTFSASGTALSTSTWKLGVAGTNTALATTFLVVQTGNTPQYGGLIATVASGFTAGDTCALVGAGGGSILTWSAAL